MELKEISLNWTNRYEIISLSSVKAHNKYNNRRVVNDEYGAWVDGISEFDLIHALVALEQASVLYDNLPEEFNSIVFDGCLKDMEIDKILNWSRDQDSICDDLLSFVENADAAGQSVFLQRRIKWAISFDEDNRKFFVYGRFKTGVL